MKGNEQSSLSSDHSEDDHHSDSEVADEYRVASKMARGLDPQILLTNANVRNNTFLQKKDSV